MVKGFGTNKNKQSKHGTYNNQRIHKTKIPRICSLKVVRIVPITKKIHLQKHYHHHQLNQYH